MGGDVDWADGDGVCAVERGVGVDGVRVDRDRNGLLVSYYPHRSLLAHAPVTDHPSDPCSTIGAIL